MMPGLRGRYERSGLARLARYLDTDPGATAAASPPTVAPRNSGGDTGPSTNGAGSADADAKALLPWSRVQAAARAHPEVTTALVILGVALLSLPWLVRHRVPNTVGWQIALILPLIWRRRAPVGVFAAISVLALAQWFFVSGLIADLSLLIALYGVAAYRPRRTALLAATVLEVGVVMAISRHMAGGAWPHAFVFLSLMVGAALLLGVNMRTRRAHLATLIERAERLEHERDQQARLAAVAERTRIAREMHDVLAHSLAVIISLADGAAAKLSTEPDRAATAIAHVSDLGRQSLRDTRRLLGVLRADDGPGSIAPQPDVSQLDDLVARVRTTGLDASLAIAGDPFDIPPGAGLTVYRIVQEALTNSLKHASGARAVQVRLRYQAPELDVEVSDDGHPGPLDGVLGDAARPSGHGLAGMRERASVYQGTITAGPRPGGVWRVRARLPVGPGGTR